MPECREVLSSEITNLLNEKNITPFLRGAPAAFLRGK